MKPAWDKLGDEFADSATVIIGDVDCTVEKSLCSQYGVRGYPTIKYFTGATASEGDKYEGGRDFETLKKFASESLGPSCSPDNLDLCDDEQKENISAAQALSPEDRKAQIAEKVAAIDAAEENFKAELEKLQARYTELMEEKDATIASIQPSLSVLRSIKDAPADDAAHDEL